MSLRKPPRSARKLSTLRRARSSASCQSGVPTRPFLNCSQSKTMETIQSHFEVTIVTLPKEFRLLEIKRICPPEEQVSAVIAPIPARRRVLAQTLVDLRFAPVSVLEHPLPLPTALPRQNPAFSWRVRMSGALHRLCDTGTLRGAVQSEQDRRSFRAELLPADFAALAYGEELLTHGHTNLPSPIGHG